MIYLKYWNGLKSYELCTFSKFLILTQESSSLLLPTVSEKEHSHLQLKLPPYFSEFEKFCFNEQTFGSYLKLIICRLHEGSHFNKRPPTSTFVNKCAGLKSPHIVPTYPLITFPLILIAKLVTAPPRSYVTGGVSLHAPDKSIRAKTDKKDRKYVKINVCLTESAQSMKTF